MPDLPLSVACDRNDRTQALFDGDVSPVGIALLASGILYFLVAGKYLLPQAKEKSTGAPPRLRRAVAGLGARIARDEAGRTGLVGSAA